MKFGRTEIVYNMLAICHSPKPLTDEGGEETRISGKKKTLTMIFRKMLHTQPRKIKPQPRLEPAFKHWRQALARNADELTITLHIIDVLAGSDRVQLGPDETCYSLHYTSLMFWRVLIGSS